MNNFQKSGIVLLCLLLSYGLYSQSFKTIYQIPESTRYTHHYEFTQDLSKSDPISGLAKSIVLKIEPDIVSALHESKSPYISITLPTDGGESETLLLNEVQISQGKDFCFAKTSEGRIQINDTSRHFRGIIRGKPNSKVAVSASNEGIMAMIIDKKSQKTLAKSKQNGSYIYYDTQDLLNSSGFNCGADGLQSFDSPSEYSLSDEKGKSNSNNCVGMYLEVDFDIYLDHGTFGATSSFIMGLFNQVSAIYAAESITLNIQELNIWTQQDPYNGPNTIDYLNQFQNEINGEFNGDLAHLIGYGSGGIAYVNTLCYSQYAIGFSGISGNYEEVPIYSWSVEVLAHEIGHNLGSAHTHSCAWNNNNTAIDGCGPAVDANEGCDGPIPVKGTIMSYCHLMSGVGIDFNLGFGPQPGDRIRTKISNSSCLVACEPGCTSSGQICDDNDPCTINDTYDEDCNCIGSYQDADEDGYCVGMDPDDHDSCMPDNSGDDCNEGCMTYNYSDVELDYGIWNDGGSDCIRSLSSDFAYEGNYSILLRDNSGASSSTYTDNLPINGIDDLQLEFVYYAYSMEDGEDFMLEISLDGGLSYSNVKSWTSGIDFKNGDFYSESVSITGYQLTNTTKLRLRCDASTNTDRIYLDNLIISTCSQASDCDFTGQACQDGDPCTSGETYDSHCNCTGGISVDNDEDGVCSELDPDDTDACNPNTNHPNCDQCLDEGKPCDDNDICTIGEVYDVDCNCIGGISTDNDEDGLCSELDPDDSDPCNPNTNNPNCDLCPEEGDLCSDGDACTLGETYDSDCNCNGGIYIDNDEDGYCVGNDPDDTDPCNPDASLCAQDPCNTYNLEGYELSMGIWNDGGSDCQRILNTVFATTGNYSMRIRDNSGSNSSFSTDNIDASGYQSIEVTFSFIANSMELDEDFFLELSTNGGSTYTLVEDWISGIDFDNNIGYTVTTLISSPVQFASNTRLRLRCDASTNSDQVYIDDIHLELCGAVQTDDSTGVPNLLEQNKVEADVAPLSQPLDPILNIYPNPISKSDRLQILVEDSSIINQIRLYDIYGRLHINQEITEQSSIHSLDIGEMKTGTYVVVVLAEGKQWPQKIVID